MLESNFEGIMGEDSICHLRYGGWSRSGYIRDMKTKGPVTILVFLLPVIVEDEASKNKLN